MSFHASHDEVSGGVTSSATQVAATNFGSPILKVTDLVKQYGGVRAVDGVSFEVQPGTIVGIIGPNGAGKSTALTMISGFASPTSGRIEFGGQDVTHQPMHMRARQGLVRTFQIARVFDGLTAIENLIVAVPNQRSLTPMGLLAGRRYWKQEEDAIVDRAYHLMETFGMGEKANERARNLSASARTIRGW